MPLFEEEKKLRALEGPGHDNPAGRHLAAEDDNQDERQDHEAGEPDGEANLHPRTTQEAE
jgi:hypothetical protein